MAHDVFISYSSKDKTVADAACAVLEQDGIRCWIAPRDIRPGDDWGETIIGAITASRAFLLVFSSHANESRQVKREVERAVNRGLPVIPMRIEEVMPAKALEYFLSTPHWLDAFTPPLSAHLTFLAGVIRQILDGHTAQGRPNAPRARAGVDRRGVLALGVAGLAAGAGALTYALWPRDDGPAPSSGPEVVAAPPSFEGKWVLDTLAISQEGWQGIAVSNVAALSDPFVRSSVAGKTLAITFEVSDLSQYKFDIEAIDEGAIATQGKRVRVTPKSGVPPFESDFYLIAPEDSVNVLDSLGGKAGDGVLVFENFPGYGQLDYCGVLQQRVTGPAASIAASWNTIFPPTPVGPAMRYLEIVPEGQYRYRAELKDRGIWQGADGKWSRQRQNGMEVRGTYRFDGPDRVTLASGPETMVFRRV